MPDDLKLNRTAHFDDNSDESALFYQLDLLKTLNAKLSESARIFDGFTSMSKNAFIYYNFETGHFEAVGDFHSILGVDIKTITDTELLVEFVMEENSEILKHIVSPENYSEDSYVGDFCLRSSRRWVSGSARIYRNANNEPVEKYICFADITRSKVSNDELKYLAYYDSLTGLINRNHFIAKLNTEIEKAKEENAKISLALIDINSFKRVNDSLGLVYGDELIQLFSQLLKDFNNDKVTVGRFGTDVFVVSIYDPEGKDTIENIVRNIRHRLKKPIILSNKDQLYISITVGVAEFPDSASSGLALLQNAEICVYEAKGGDRDKIYYFDNNLMSKFLDSFTIEKKLHDAILVHNFVLFYQPQYQVGSGKLRGCEALIRWVDNDGSYISPVKFIPLAEKSGGIVPIGKWVIETAVRKVKEWQQKYNFDGVMSINISAIQLKKDRFVDELIDYISSENVDPSKIEIEITESVLVENSREMIEKVQKMRDFGLRLALDDFGTGFSSLSYLKDLPISTLKIDKSFIDTVISDDATGIITESVVNMVRRLGLETIAEGVEENAQMDFLRKINCDNIQGFLLGKPMPDLDFERKVLGAI